MEACITASQSPPRRLCPTLLNVSPATVWKLTVAACLGDYCQPEECVSVCTAQTISHTGGEAPGPVKNGVNFSSYGKAKNGLSMATERALKGGNTEHAISDPLFVRAHIHAHTTTYGHYGSSQSLTVSRRSLATRERDLMRLNSTLDASAPPPFRPSPHKEVVCRSRGNPTSVSSSQPEPDKSDGRCSMQN